MPGPGDNKPPVVIARFKCAAGGSPMQPVVSLMGVSCAIQYQDGMAFISVTQATAEAMTRLQAECLPWDGVM